MRCWREMKKIAIIGDYNQNEESHYLIMESIKEVAEEQQGELQAQWIMSDALDVPALGTCAGFQHMVIEFARNVLGLYSADSEENDTECADAVIKKLSCTLMNKMEQLKISDSNSILARTVGGDRLIGEYRCNYGFNEAYHSVFQNSNVITTIVETKNGYFRGFELKEHPFFIGSLFIPQLDFRGDSSYRIIKSFVKVVLDMR